MDRDRKAPQQDGDPPKKPWQKPELRYLGNVGDMLQVGAGKISHSAGDPGEPKKQRHAR